MKHLITMATVAAVLLSFAAFANAKGTARGGKGKTGIEGTVEAVGSQGFTLTTTDGKTLKVLCNANTKFKSGEQDAAPSDIKQGTRVNIQGGLLSADEIMANTVTIMPASGGKKKKK